MSTRYINIKTCTHGATPITTIDGIDIDQTANLITDGGDNDAYDSFAARGRASTRVTLSLKDPVQAQALKAAAAADLVFRGVPEEGGTEVVVTVSDVTFGGARVGGGHNRLWTGSLPGVAYKSDGTDPVSIAAAS